MSKKRKTKKEKIMASSRRPVLRIVEPQQTEHPSITLEIPRYKSHDNNEEKHAISATINYSYVITGVRKTLFISTILVALNILLFFILKLKLISISGIVF